MRTLMELVHQFPGTTFSNITERGDYAADEKACITLPELERILALYVCNIYNRSYHKGAKDRPIERYTNYYKAINGNATIPLRVVDSQRFTIDLLPYEERHLTRRGFELFGISYFDECLIAWLAAPHGRGTPKHLLRYDPRDISRIHVFDPAAGQYLGVGYRDRSQPAMSGSAMAGPSKPCNAFRTSTSRVGVNGRTTCC